MRTLISLLILSVLSACGGGSAAVGGGTTTYSLSGFVTSAASGAAMPSVTMTLSGSASATTSTDGTGHYNFGGLSNGDYAITAALADTAFTPQIQPVTISGANIVDASFLATQAATVASGIAFLPQSVSSANQLRASLILNDGNLVFTDSSDFPLRIQPLDGSPMISLARRFGTARSVVVKGDDIYWIEAGKLHRTSPAGQTTVLADTQNDSGFESTADIVVDDLYAYRVDTIPSLSCSPPCTRVIEKIPLAGGAPITLATVDRPVVSLKSDANNIYWEEWSLEPLDAGCNCGSKIKSVPKAGGSVTVLVDGFLNGTLPPVPPGHIPASWLPAGGIAVTATEIIFSVVGNDAYDLKAIPIQGGIIRDLASVPSSAGFSRAAILDISVVDSNVYWIDPTEQTLDSMPLAGGNVTVLASGLNMPGAMVLNATTAFWTESGSFSGCCLQMGEGSIKQVPLAGGSVSTVLAGLDGPTTLAVDSNKLVWNEVWRVAEAPLAGGTTTTLVSGIASAMARIAVAQTNIYILDGGMIKVLPLTGGTVEKLASAHFGLIDDLGVRSQDIAADDTSVYWTVKGFNAAPIVQKIALAGGAPVTLANEFIITNPQDCYWRIAVDSQHVYWSEASATFPVGCAVKNVPVNGGAITTVIDHSFVTDFAVDGANVYISELGSDSIQKTPVGGGAITPVAIGIAPWMLLNDANDLYWLDLQFNTIGRISKAPGTPTSNAFMFPIELAMDPFIAFESLFIDESAIYVTETQTGSIHSIF